ncbi:MAG: hypothetical protein BGO55_00185 [Sphingobacteriales bacterium 50-39]|nr:hypothetical protein [Sphingobacteriales bacterium]OJW53541.1 MAG: hypothetical protein BGO55_00185 [Sphingobacteriales bacterium 50-39]
MKKIITLVLSAILLLFFFACHKDHTPSKPVLTITGTVEDCSGALLDSGYVIVWVDNTSHQASLKKGLFTISIQRNDTTTGMVRIIPYDAAVKMEGYPDTVYAGVDSVNVGVLLACDAHHFLTITGDGYTCNPMYIDSGYVTILVDGVTHRVDIHRADRGHFSFTVGRKDTTVTDVTITAYDLVNLREGLPQIYHFGVGTFDASMVVACKKDQVIQATANGYAYGGLSSPGDNISYSVSDTGCSISGSVGCCTYGPNIDMDLPVLTGAGPVKMKRFRMSLHSDGFSRYKGYDLDCNIIEFGPVGGYIKGTFTGIVNYDSQIDNNPNMPVTGNFTVKRTQ